MHVSMVISMDLGLFFKTCLSPLQPLIESMECKHSIADLYRDHLDLDGRLFHRQFLRQIQSFLEESSTLIDDSYGPHMVNGPFDNNHHNDKKLDKIHKITCLIF